MPKKVSSGKQSFAKLFLESIRCVELPTPTAPTNNLPVPFTISMFDFDMEAMRNRVLTLNPGIEIFEVSSKTGEGIPAWIARLSPLTTLGHFTILPAIPVFFVATGFCPLEHGHA